MKIKNKMKIISKLKKTPNMETTAKFDDLKNQYSSKEQDNLKNKTIWTLEQPQKRKWETK